jgi:cytidylate kinase
MAVLTISRQFGSGGKAIGEGIANALGYEYIDRGRMHRDLRAKGPRFEEWAKAFDEHYPAVSERSDWGFRGFVALIQSIILDYARKDKVVIVGTGAAFLLKGIPHVLRIRVIADLETRIDRVQGDDVVSAGTARWLIQKADSEMAGAVYTIYGAYWDDPHAYDMVFDTSVETREAIIEKVRSGLLERDPLNTEQVRRVLETKALAAKIKAIIAVDPTFMVSVLDVEMKEEGMAEYGLMVRGIVHNREDIQRIQEIARVQAGDMPVEFDLVYRMGPRTGPWQFK